MKTAILMQRGHTAKIGLVLSATLVLSGCGGAIQPGPSAPASGTTTSPPTSTGNLFANSYTGKVALRDSISQLTGNFATVNFTIAANSQVSGTVVVQSGSIDTSLRTGKITYRSNVLVARGAPNGTINITGTSDSQAHTLTANGTGNDANGMPLTVTVQGTLQQLSTMQLASTSLSVNDAATTSTGSGLLSGTASVKLSSNSLPPPILTLDSFTGDFKIPQGATVRFLPTGTDQPANPDQTETRDVVNFTIPNYHSPGFDGYSNIDNGGWIFAYDGKYIIIKVPDDAPITSGYEVRDRSTGNPVSAQFTVAPPVVTLFFGGFFDSSATQIVQSYVTGTFQPAHESIVVNYYPYTGEADALALIKNLSPKCRVNLVGHSYGGDTAASVATDAGRKIDLLVTIDPVSYFGPRYSTIKNSTNSWYDVNATGGGPFDFDNMIAGVGSAWNSGPKSYIPTTYFEAPYTHGDFVDLFNSNGVEAVVSQASQ